MKRPRGGTQLRVRERTTIGAAGPRPAEPTVHCARHERAALVSECASCGYGGPQQDGPDGALICCRHPDAANITLPGVLAKRRVPSDAERTPLSSIMTASVISVSPDLPVESLALLLLQQRISGVPVVNDAGRPVGVVSRSDLLRLELAPAEGAVVADIMMPVAFTLTESANVSHAAALMAYEDIHRVPVVAADGTVVGIISSLDVVRWLARHDGFLVPDPNDPIAID
jgi:CBS domain-containing protein